MFFGRHSAFMRTLRFRLMLWNALAVVLTGVGILLCVREGVRFTLVHELDQVLNEDLEEISLGFEKGSGVAWNVRREELERKALGHKFHGWFVRFYDAQGKSTWHSTSAPQIAELDSVSGDAASRQ